MAWRGVEIATAWNFANLLDDPLARELVQLPALVIGILLMPFLGTLLAIALMSCIAVISEAILTIFRAAGRWWPGQQAAQPQATPPQSIGVLPPPGETCGDDLELEVARLHELITRYAECFDDAHMY